MKTKLLLSLLLTSVFGFSQAPINDYFAPPNSMFAIVTGTIDHTASGANATWNFNGLTPSGTNTDTFAGPSPQQLMDYAGTTQVLTITDTAANTNELFHIITGSTLSFTGANNTDFTIDYNTDNALVGTYPLTFGTAATNDAIAGTLSAQGQTPTYTGTITTEVNAYGTLNVDVTGQGTYSGSVTRIKTEQFISFTVFGFFPGTGVIINYNYYKDIDGTLVFRSTDGIIDVPGVFTQTFASSEALITNTLSVPNSTLTENAIKLYPNPIESILNIELNNNLTIQSLKIQDINGRTVLSSLDNNTSINISHLKTGIYIMTVSTEAGSITKKLIKK